MELLYIFAAIAIGCFAYWMVVSGIKLVVGIIFGLIKLILKGIWWVVTLPFRGLVALFRRVF